MFSGLMVNTWIVASIVAVVAALVGFFVVLRGAAFAAHAVPNGSLAGAAGAGLLGVNVLVGLGAFSLLGAAGIGLIGRRERHDVAVALSLVLMLGVGALLLSFSVDYAPATYSLLFGEILGVSHSEVLPTGALALACVAFLAAIYRPLMLSSILAEVSEARGIRSTRIELLFLVCVALVTTMTVPVVGTTLIFSLMIGAPGAARSFTKRPATALALSVAIALATVWLAIASAYDLNLPVGFFVGVFAAGAFAAGRGWSAWRSRRPSAE
jgi:zinc/manganese transport system permease protein